MDLEHLPSQTSDNEPSDNEEASDSDKENGPPSKRAKIVLEWEEVVVFNSKQEATLYLLNINEFNQNDCKRTHDESTITYHRKASRGCGSRMRIRMPHNVSNVSLIFVLNKISRHSLVAYYFAVYCGKDASKP